jgi:hypothetical protein
MSVRALGGGPLTGDEIVRLVYLDESGTGDRATEPHVVVAGVVVNADRQWKAVENYMRRASERYGQLLGVSKLVFHATDIFRGDENGQWPNAKYDLHFRLKAIRTICNVPALFDLPVVTGFVERALGDARLPDDTPSEQTKVAHVAASVRCAVGVERYMRANAEKNEVAMLIYENTDHARKMIRELHNDLSINGIQTLPNFANWELREYLPVTRIIDTAYFADKADTCMLQIADACAFALRRYLAKRSHGEDLVNCFRPKVWKTVLPASSSE